VVRIFIAARHDEITNFEVGKLGGLAIFVVFGLVGEVDGYRGAIGADDLKRIAVDGSDFPDGSVAFSWTTLA
jgi:hypothetical protein